MEDDKLKVLFKSFDPELSSDINFMAHLQRSMETIECIRRQNATQRKRNKVAIIIAAASGFIMGIILTLLFPIISNWLTNINASLPTFKITSLNIDPSFIGWIIIAGACIILTINVYELTLAKLTSKTSPA